MKSMRCDENIKYLCWFVCIVIAQVEIIEMEESTIKKIEEMREKMVQATNEAALTVMGLDNELADLEVQI